MTEAAPTRLACGCDPEQGDLCATAREIWKRLIDLSTAQYPGFDPIDYQQALLDWQSHWKEQTHGS